MRKASTRLPEQGTQTPSPAPDLIPAEPKNQPRTHIAIGPANGGTSKPWNVVTIEHVLTNPKYTGCNVWHRFTQRLDTPRKRVDPRFWIKKAFAFPPIVDQYTFDRAQATLQTMRDSHWSSERILKRIRRLLKAKGELSERLLQEARGMPCTNTIHKHFGTYQQLYEKVGFKLAPVHVLKVEQAQRSARLRQALGHQLESLFPNHVVVTLSWRGKRSILRIDDTFTVSILFCRKAQSGKGPCWEAQPALAERDGITLICLLNGTYDRVLHYYVARKLGQWESLRMYRNGPFLRGTAKLDRLSDFYSLATRIWEKRSA